MTPKFNIGDVVSTIPSGQVSSRHRKIGVFNINGHNFKLKTILYYMFNDEEKEYWYQFANGGNWYNESGLIRVYEEVKNYEIY